MGIELLLLFLLYSNPSKHYRSLHHACVEVPHTFFPEQGRMKKVNAVILLWHLSALSVYIMSSNGFTVDFSV